jgi:hypothetical protein
MKLIVHAGTGTVIDADDGVFVIDTDLIRDEALVALLEDGDEYEIVEIAKDKGRRLCSADLETTYQKDTGKGEAMITPQTDSEFHIELGSGYDDPEVEYAYICSVADNVKTTHVVAVNAENRPLFKVVDDEGIIIEPGYKTIDLAVLAAKAWLS